VATTLLGIKTPTVYFQISSTRPLEFLYIECRTLQKIALTFIDNPVNFGVADKNRKKHTT
jgi:hypothetical protein